MPKIQWEHLPREKWAHLRDRAKERQISQKDLFALAEWKAEDPPHLGARSKGQADALPREDHVGDESGGIRVRANMLRIAHRRATGMLVPGVLREADSAT
jgi:hypothetical protein